MRTERGQALMELACGMFALALLVSALCGFALYCVKGLRVQNHARVGGPSTDSVEVGDFAAQYAFDKAELQISEPVRFPSTTILR